MPSLYAGDRFGELCITIEAVERNGGHGRRCCIVPKSRREPNAVTRRNAEHLSGFEQASVQRE